MELTTKKWARVRINRSEKKLTMTNKEIYSTKGECESHIKSAQYIAINSKALDKLISEGYTLVDAEIKVAQEVAPVTEIVDLTGNPDIEAQIEAYTKDKIERDIEAYAKKKANEDKIKAFLTPVEQVKVHKFDYSKQLNKFYEKDAPRNAKLKQLQVAEYCGEVLNI